MRIIVFSIVLFWARATSVEPLPRKRRACGIWLQIAYRIVSSAHQQLAERRLNSGRCANDRTSNGLTLCAGS